MIRRVLSGETVFITAEPTLWDMRQATKLALRDDIPKTPFVVTDEVHYYGRRHLLTGAGVVLQGESAILSCS